MSDLVVILALIAIAIPIILTVQHWLGAQATKVSTYASIPSIYVTVLSKSKTDSNQSFVVKIENKGSETYVLNTTNVKLVFSDGTYETTSCEILSGSSTISSGSEVVILVGTTTLKDVTTMVLSLTSKSTGRLSSVTVNLT